MRALRLLPIFVPFVVTGCVIGGSAADWAPEREMLAAAPVCCRSPADFIYDSVAIRQRVSVEVGPQSPAFEFSGEKSYFHAFELPRTMNILSLVVTSEAPQKGFPAPAGMFYPGVLFLNENKEPVFTLPPSEAGYVDDLRLHALTLIGTKDRWRYFVVFTTPQTLRDGMPVQTKVSQSLSAMIPVGGILVPTRGVQISPGRIYRGAPATPVARLTIWIDEIQRPSPRD